MEKIYRAIYFISLIFFTGVVMSCGGGGGGDGQSSQPPPSNTQPTTQPTRTTIGSSGGTVQVTDQASPIFGTKVIIPSDALTQNISVEIKVAENPPPLVTPSGVTYQPIGQIIDLLPSGTTFNVSVTIQLKYTDSQIASAKVTNENSIGVLWFNTETGLYEAITIDNIDTNLNTVSVNIVHFSTVLLFAREEIWQLRGYKWQKRDITYCIESAKPTDVHKDREQIIKDSFAIWDSHAHDIRIIETKNCQQSDIVIKSSNNTDSVFNREGRNPQDIDATTETTIDPINEFFAVKSIIHFNNNQLTKDLNKLEEVSQSLFFKAVILHEIGHALGIAHTISGQSCSEFVETTSSRRLLTAIMCGKGSQEFDSSSFTAELTSQEIAAIQFLYGKTPATLAASILPIQDSQNGFKFEFLSSIFGGTRPYNYSWSFGDGQSSTAVNPSHTYTRGGKFSIKLTVTDDTGARVDSTVEITVATLQVSNNPPAPTAPAITTTTGTAGTSQISVNDPDSGQTHTFTITTAPVNGTANVNATGLVTYTSSSGFAGSDSLVVTVTDSGNPSLSGTVTVNVTVTSPSRSITVSKSVSSTSPWQDTGLDVNTGDIITITASGTVQFDTSGGTSTPNGTGGFATINPNGTCDFLVCGQAIPQKSLVGRIGSGDLKDFRTGFFVGSSFTTMATTAGRLFLGFNDGFVRPDRSGLDTGAVGDNSGSFSVTVTIGETVLVPPSIADVALIGTVAEVFTTTGGNFKVSVSPKDGNGNLITSGVTAANFAFKDITVALAATPGTLVTRGSANVTSVDIIQPTAGKQVNLALDFDSSGSMRNNDPLRLRVSAGKQLVSILKVGDQAAIMDFGAGTMTGLRASRLLQDFTSDKTLLANAIERVTESGSTPLFSSLLDALDLLRRQSPVNPAVVVLTDGEANSNDVGFFDDVVTQANIQSTPIFTVGLGRSINFTQLQKLANDTGGAFAEATDATALNIIFEDIGFGITQGRIVVNGEGRFTPPLTQPGKYVVIGVLVTTIGSVSKDTLFNFTVDVQ